ncbi:MAG: YkgJ family cysteine cluster protein [Pseudobdellovibrionaceae bacterium]
MKTPSNLNPTSSRFFKDGLKFQCQSSGNCCTSRGEYGFVFLTKDDRQRMANQLKISPSAFTRKYCEKTKGLWHLKEEKGKPDCMFLSQKKCSIYEARPTQCRTWPFWPEVMNAKTWSKEVASFCPGVGKGKLHSAKDIQTALDLQSESEKDLAREM